MSLRRPALPLALVAALLPLPMAIMATACGGDGAIQTAATVNDVRDTGPPAVVEGQTPQQAETTRLSLSRTATGTFLDELDIIHTPWSGDLDAMVEREVIRALVPMSKTFYFLDGAEQRGISYEGAKMFEEQINDKLERGHLKVHVVLVPVARDELIDGVLEGYGDIALGNITMTPERTALVDFSDPFMGDIRELVVTGPGSPELAGLDDLGGEEIMVRESSSYHASLLRLNDRFRAEGKDEIILTPAPEILEDEDLLEMVNAGLVPIVVVDSHKAQFWAQIFTDLVVRDDLAVATDQQIGWAFRKDSPLLAAAINEFVADHKKGTLLGNMAFNRYLRDTKWVERALAEEGRARLLSLVALFQKYGEQYDMPWLLVAAQGYQESRLDQSVRSPAGAVGVMQLLPSTASDPNVAIADIHEVENNIHAGVKYLRFVYDRYFADAENVTELDKGLFSFAAYNAGPARVARLRGKADDMGLDPNVWFRNVEIVAAQDIGRETVQYVSNIFKYYVAYERMLMMEEARRSVREQGFGTG
jgi:membrane-bound lytic murein transglycosylase MltF